MFTVTEAFAQFKLNLEFAKTEKANRKMERKLIIIRLAADAVSHGDSITAIKLAIKYYKYSGGGYNARVNAIIHDALMQHVTSLVDQAREVRTLDDKLVFAQEAFTDIEKYKKWLMPYSREDTVYHESIVLRLKMMAGDIID
jgi:uncharacterized protein (DUF4415 family)